MILSGVGDMLPDTLMMDVLGYVRQIVISNLLCNVNCEV